MSEEMRVSLPMTTVGRRPCLLHQHGGHGLPHAEGQVGGEVLPHHAADAVGSKEKRAVHGPKRKRWRARCSGPPRDGGRRIGASADLARPSGTLYSSAISPTAVPWRIVRRSSGWSSHGAASLFAAASCPARELPIKASAPTTARAARSEAERAERGAGQMRPCTPLTSASTPRESAFKPVPHPRRARWPVLANTQAPSHANPRTATLHARAELRPKAFFSFGPCTACFLFGQDRKENGGASR